MVANLQVPHLGTGLYTPREVASFAKVRTQTLNRWFFGDARGEPALRPRIRFENVERDDRLLTFHDLIEAVAVRTMRKSCEGKIELLHIRDVVNECEERGLTSPLARQHTLYWFSNRLILKTSDSDYIGLKPGTDKSQLYHGVIIEPFLKEVTFDGGLAQVWTPLSSANFAVKLDADRRFGMPIIEPGGLLVSALTDAVLSEGSIDSAAAAFDLSVEAVLLALKYEEYLMSPA